MAPIFSPMARTSQWLQKPPANPEATKSDADGAATVLLFDKEQASSQQPSRRGSGAGAQDNEKTKALGQGALLSSPVAAYEEASKLPTVDVKDTKSVKSVRGGKKKKAIKRPPTAPSPRKADKAEPLVEELIGHSGVHADSRPSSRPASARSSSVPSERPSSNSRTSSAAPSRSTTPRDKRASTPRDRRNSLSASHPPALLPQASLPRAKALDTKVPTGKGGEGGGVKAKKARAASVGRSAAPAVR
uniref:Uncharacterized protein n=1 Tax=Haptolina brevifila TaxID=156173 RepID=A0A7S2B6X8_9EUKA